MKIVIIALALLFTACLDAPDENGIIREGCDGPDHDPNTRCEQGGGGGGGGGTGGGGGGGGGTGHSGPGTTPGCPIGQRWYPDIGQCGPPPGSICAIVRDQACTVGLDGMCHCPGDQPTLMSELEAMKAELIELEKDAYDVIAACLVTCFSKWTEMCPAMDTEAEYQVCANHCIVDVPPTVPAACEDEYSALQHCRSDRLDSYYCRDGAAVSRWSCLLAQISLADCRRQYLPSGVKISPSFDD